MNQIRRPRALFAACAVAGALSCGPASADPVSVLELFTSQGCSSCPPADALLAEFAERAEILALSFPVDYWNYLGWEDTLASRDNTLRQRGYAQARGDRQVYTPQIVIDGRDHVVGSDRTAIEKAIDANWEMADVEVDLTFNPDALNISIGEAPAGVHRRGTVWLVLFDRTRTVDIRGGENSGRTLTYHNVVREMRRIAMWKGHPISVDLPLLDLRLAGTNGCAAILQVEAASGIPGPILGAGWVVYQSAEAIN